MKSPLKFCRAWSCSVLRRLFIRLCRIIDVTAALEARWQFNNSELVPCKEYAKRVSTCPYSQKKLQKSYQCRKTTQLTAGSVLKLFLLPLLLLIPLLLFVIFIIPLFLLLHFGVLFCSSSFSCCFLSCSSSFPFISPSRQWRDGLT